MFWSSTCPRAERTPGPFFAAARGLATGLGAAAALGVLIVAMASPAFAVEPDAARPAGMALNLKSVDVRDVLASIAESRGLNIVVAPDVEGRVTVNLHDLDVDETLRAVLLVNGLTYVRRDGVIYVTREGATSLNGRAWIETVTFRLSYADPRDVAAAVKDALSENGKITAYQPTRTVVLQDTPESVDRARAIIAAIDVAPRQVLIGARILEIRLDDDASFGVDWNSVMRASRVTVDAQQFGFADQPTPGLRGFFATISTKNLDGFLEALEEVVHFQALAAPQVLALEGREAQIIVGGKLGFYVTTTTQTSTVQSVEFLDIGSLLTLTPTVTDDGHMVLDIHPKVSDGVVNNGLPTETTTEVTTSVLVADGETIFIGGLLRKRDELTRSTVPIVGRLPGLGYLFGNSNDSQSRSEVVVLITPRIVRPGAADHAEPLDLDGQPGGNQE